LDRSGDALMPSPVDNGANARQAETLGLPEGLKIGSAYPFGGLNMADSRTGIDDREFSWLENYVRVGKGRMRTSYDVGPNLYQATGRKIVSFYWFAIGADTFCAVFHDDGTAAQVDLGGNSVWISSTPGTFYVAGSPPACSPWGAQYLIISNNFQPNAYWLWDGTVLYAPGTISPVISISDGGSNYSSAPTVTAVGGAGSGATFAATVENGSVVNVVPTSPGSGYGPADVVQLLFSGGGSDTGAVLQASLTEGNISAILVTNGGTGYTTVRDRDRSAGTVWRREHQRPCRRRGLYLSANGHHHRRRRHRCGGGCHRFRRRRYRVHRQQYGLRLHIKADCESQWRGRHRRCGHGRPVRHFGCLDHRHRRRIRLHWHANCDVFGRRWRFGRGGRGHRDARHRVGRCGAERWFRVYRHADPGVLRRRRHRGHGNRKRHRRRADQRYRHQWRERLYLRSDRGSADRA
jgi:hypothetical protein